MEVNKAEGQFVTNMCKRITKLEADFASVGVQCAESLALNVQLENRLAAAKRVVRATEKILWVFVCHCDPAYKRLGKHEPNATGNETMLVLGKGLTLHDAIEAAMGRTK